MWVFKENENVDMKMVIFLDETWLNSNPSKDVGWTDKDISVKN